MDVLVEEANLDLCGDGTSWNTTSYGEAGSVLTQKVNNKPVVTKGVQPVLLRDVNYTRPCVYMHIHRLHRKPSGWGSMGKIQVKNLMEDLKPMIQVKGGDKKSSNSIHIIPSNTATVRKSFQTGLDRNNLVVPSLA